MQQSESLASTIDPDAPANILTVSSLNRMARSILESNFPAVIVEGEISNLAMPSSGHWYLTLKDKSAQIRCAMFRANNRNVRFNPTNGNQIIVRGRLSIYEGRGDYQLIADSMEEAGDGALRRAFEELKARLQAEGLFDQEKKQEVRSRYDHIGVVTSPTGAALQDILSVFRRRFPATRITLFPVTVQGSDAVEQIVSAIESANRHRHKLDLQALIVSRGGGSLEDLQAFNEERVAQAIYVSELPVTSAVGHEIDFTIADFVADLRAPTPSSAAELMSPDQEDYFQLLQAYQLQFRSAIGQKLRQAQQVLAWLIKQLKHPDRRLQEQAQNLDRLENRLRLAISHSFSRQASDLNELARSLLAHSPTQRLQHLKIQMGNGIKSLRQAATTLIKTGDAKLGELSRSLNTVSPLGTLGRGYSITYDDSAKVIRRSDDVKIGSKILSRLNRGKIISVVESVANDEN
jgi:exodeoxyribonuclease VII large subunit